MKKVDIVLVKPGNQKQLYGELSAFGLTAIEPPFWVALWGGYLRKLGYSVVLYDAEAENWSLNETAEKIVETKARLAAVVVSGTNPSASTMNMAGAGKIVSLVRELDPSIKTFLAGLHPSALPEDTLINENTDFVCQGEGFHTLPKLIDLLRNNADDYPVKGLWYKKNGKIIANPRPPLMKNLDELPMPAWDLLPMTKYRAHNWHCFDNIENRQPYAVLYTTLGCPFRCSFCCINALFGKNTIRYRSLDRIIEEIDFLVNTYGIRNIKIMDEMFGLNENRIVSLCDTIKDRGYDLNMWAYARVDTVSEKMLAKMKTAGVNWVAYGFESGSKKIIENVSKGYKMDLVKKVVEVTYNQGMYICANFIFGLPEDDFDTMTQTFKLMLDINAEWANIYVAMAYPGSKLYELALTEGWQLPNSWQGYSQYSFETLPLPTRFLTAGEVLSFRDYAFHAYYGNPNYLNKINRLFGIKTVQHIQKMTEHRLKRQHTRF
jgi:radical SAM superfamily enzyme YgiQ (UPF0313 family)